MRSAIQPNKIEKKQNQQSLLSIVDFDALKLFLASAEDILQWSYGEIIKPETINYRTQRPEKDGLFSERIFGPTKDYECYCGKYKKMRYKGVVCDRCGVEVTNSIVRRERMGSITLAAPCSHIWFLRGIPSRIGTLLDISLPQLEKVVYYTGYIIVSVDDEAKKRVLEELAIEFSSKTKALKKEQKGKSLEENLKKLELSYKRTKDEIQTIQKGRILTELEYQQMAMKFGHIFEAETGSEPVRKILQELDLKKLYRSLAKEIQNKKSLSRKKLLIRLRLVKSVIDAGIKPESMFLTVLPVIPPDLRPMVQLDGGRYASSDLNDLYRRIINRNNRLRKLIEINSPEVIVRNEKRMLQEAVDALIDNSSRKTQSGPQAALASNRRPLRSLADILKGKQGRFRQNLLGKRVDYSGRSVIVVGPELHLDQCGVPKKMALEIFKPFVINGLVSREIAHNTKAASRMIEDYDPVVWEILEEVIRDKYMLLNRAPTLHRLSIQAFKPILIEGLAIQIPPMVCQAFNADFDGDAMAIHLPLSEEAQLEAKEIMLSTNNVLKPATGDPIAEPSKDMTLGIYWLTSFDDENQSAKKIFSSFEEAVYAHDVKVVGLREKIKIPVDRSNPKFSDIEDKYLETTVGRIIFNQVLDKKTQFVNDKLDKKKIQKTINEFIRFQGIAKAGAFLDQLKKLGFVYSTLSGLSWGMDDLIIPKERDYLIKETKKQIENISEQFVQGLISAKEKSVKVIQVWTNTIYELKGLVSKTLPPTGPVLNLINSKAQGNEDQAQQLMVMKGLVTGPSGQIYEIPVEGCYKEGLNPLDYFISIHGARKGLVDTALRTADAGYLTRRLVDVAQDVVVKEEDCGDVVGRLISKKRLTRVLGSAFQDFSKIIFGRVLVEDVKLGNKIIARKGDEIDWYKAKEIVDSGVEHLRVRSPLYCKTRFGLCRKCVGFDLGRNKLVELGDAVGVVAAQSIGEPGTQLTLRTFHTGGTALAADITQGLPRVEEIFELHSPKGKAALCKRDGAVHEIAPVGSDRVIKIKPLEKSTKKKSRKEFDEYPVSSGLSILVKAGDVVKKGQPLSEGSFDIKEILLTLGKRSAEEYVIKEIKKIYVSQGADIDDRWLEVIVKLMFSRVQIKVTGDSNFLPGEVIDKSRFFLVNDELKKAKKKPAKAYQLVMGISKVALGAEGFLSAASFQHTARVLIDAALSGKVDHLRGLKENVIIGKMIPSGTGFRVQDRSDASLVRTKKARK
ncbi:MAG: DNA-directed RNA polymerase subunit beta' [Parcubacteria group bacterium GW2011_GWB1_45_10]|nr:MAG: DNA-directed RNA polymerase subunit beta' [Parcubacteria group bacterium GW2011_GWB1_45_10]